MNVVGHAEWSILVTQPEQHLESCKSVAISMEGAFICTRLLGHEKDHIYFNPETNQLIAWEQD